ncbi:MAG TPA: ATP-binding protein [Thermoanaerobaculia bacterium]|nr:ATP-binding protein [Thermoanaerobaculia bacterium]
MAELALQPDEIERRRRERRWQLAVLELPLLRVIGFSILSLALFLNNRYLLGEVSLRPWATASALMAAYCIVSWVVLYATFRYLQRDLTVLFLALDVVIWTYVIYMSGAEASWLYLVLLVRVADQTQSTFRRCLGFAGFVTICYGAMLAWVAFVDGRTIAASVVAVKLTFIGAASFYIALTARTAERRRQQVAEAIRIARRMVHTSEEQSTALREARMRSEQGSAAKSEFVANMSHEMRTPLHGVIGMLQLAIDEEESPRRVRQLDMAKRSAESLLATIEDILDFSKIEARKIDIEPVYFSIRDLLAETLKPLGVTAAAKNLVLGVGVAPNVPESVWGDPLRLKQVLINLVGNAIKFTERGEITVRASTAAGYFRCEVTDTGTGIPQELRERIFAPFEQGDGSQSRRFGGTGLGLAIVRSLVEAMGGTVDLQTEPGTGSSFSFVIPLPADAVGATPQRAAWEGALAGVSVLLADPNPASRALVAEMLRAREMLVTECASAAEPPLGRYSCAITADEAVPTEPAIVITSPLEHVVDDRLRVVRPVLEPELIDTVGTALGLRRRIAARPAAAKTDPTEPLRVLVAEDNLVNQEFAAEALRKLGHRVSVASDGEEALQMMKKQIFDIVLMDVQMPKLSGLDATRLYREIEPAALHTPIVALTAHTAAEDRHRCIEAGMDAVLIKPIDLRQLHSVVRSVTDVDPIVEAVGGNVKLLERVSEAFAKQTPALMQSMRQAIADRDGEALYMAAHTMKGAVSNFQGDPSYDLAVMVEQTAKGKDFARSVALVARLEAAVAALERRISAAVTR